MGTLGLATDVERLIESLGQMPEPVAEPVLVVVSGLPGTGKSYFCRRLADRMPLTILESDALRKVLFSPPSYSTEESSHLFQAIHQVIKMLLKKGIPLILDATNLSERHRENLYNITERTGAKLIMVRVEAPPQVVAERLQNRRQDSNNRSDAEWAEYQRMQNSVERIKRRHFVVDTSRDITPVLDRVIRELNH